MYYAAMVGDKSSAAESRLVDDYNFAGYPSCFFDGGYEVLVGGYSAESYYRTRIESCGARTVPDGLDMILRIDSTGISRMTTRVRVANGVPANVAPALPDAPTGPTEGLAGDTLSFQVTTTDADGDQVYYEVDFGDNSKTTGWMGPYDENTVVEFSHVYTDSGVFQVSVRSMDTWDFDTPWSNTLAVDIAIDCCTIRGDVVANDEVNIEDLVFLVSYMFNEGDEPECLKAADINGNGSGPNIEDLVFLVTYMFNEGPAPPPCQQ
jgi:hypothetical protein